LGRSYLNTPFSKRRIASDAETALDKLWIQRNKELREGSADYSGRNVRANSLVRLGQAQFSRSIKGNYSRRCAICSIEILEFLVAAHIVRWADDERIRLDPRNGICLCSLHDKAFEHGYFFIDEKFQVVFNMKLAGDPSLQEYLQLKTGSKINLPALHAPKPEYLTLHRKSFKSAK
jgi:putative restriction endonuclease